LQTPRVIVGGINMPKFKKGHPIRISPDSLSSYRGRLGIIDAEPEKDLYGYWYNVKFELLGSTRTCIFAEYNLEAVSSELAPSDDLGSGLKS
jgi:hypothetical protein